MDKWYFIAIAVIMVSGFAGMAWKDHEQNLCKVEALKQGKSAEEINKICNK